MYPVVIILIVWFIVAAFDYSEFCHVWQLKEYRPDRFRDFISTKQGKDFFRSYLLGGRFLFFLFIILAFAFKIELSSSIFIMIVFIEIIRLAYKLFTKKIRYPKRTVKSMLIVAVAVVAELSVLYFASSSFEILALFSLRFFSLSIFVFLFYIPTKIIKRVIVWLATRKLKKFPNLRVIGITGSYGKTTVKVFLNQILSAHFKVSSTPKNINTEIGVAKFILSNNFSDKDIFIVEMGAYNVGEIKMICDMTKPEIGILTAINEQHLSLFGSIENIQKAKYELLLSLPQNGLAVVNADNKYCLDLLPSVKSGVKTFGMQKENDPDCLVEDLKTKNDGMVSFSLQIENEKQIMNGPLIGIHNASNVAACTLVACHLGMSMTEIAKQAEKLQLPDGTLQIHEYSQSIIIDDSYNANPAGFKAALEILKSYPNDFKKIVITRGMIELGEKSHELHVEIGEIISEVADELVIIAKNNEEELRSCFPKCEINILAIYDATELFEYIQKFKDNKCVVLLENRIFANVYEELIKK